jgi:hypothetical protein
MGEVQQNPRRECPHIVRGKSRTFRKPLAAGVFRNQNLKT